MHGYTIAEMQTIQIRDLDVEDRAHEIPAAIRRLEQGEPLRFEIRHYHKDRHIMELEVSASTIAFKDDNLFVAFHHDITERKQAEEQVRTLLREKELLLQEVHHRVKNNMNTISSLLSLQAQAIQNPDVASALQDTRTRVRSMSLLYDTLFRSNNFSEVSFKTYLSSLIDEVINNFPNNHIVKIEKHLDDFMLGSVKLSPLGIILNEILTNAMKYAFTGRDQGLITVSTMLEGTHVTIILKDDGIGIQDSIALGSSTGFGLTLVSALTKQIGGKVRLERNGGTTFVLDFDM
jgi:two-component sensor histidine kinase